MTRVIVYQKTFPSHSLFVIEINLVYMYSLHEAKIQFSINNLLKHLIYVNLNKKYNVLKPMHIHTDNFFRGFFLTINWRNKVLTNKEMNHTLK